MKAVILLTAALFAAPAFAQTQTDSAADDAEMQRSQLMPFYTDDTMGTMRSEADIQTYWGTLGAEDQEALKARCATTMQSSGGGDGSGGSTGETGGATEGDASGESAASGTGDSPEPTDPALRAVCDVVNTL